MIAFCHSELLYRRESESTPLPEASPLGSGERPVPARLDSVASRPLTTFGLPEVSLRHSISVACWIQASRKKPSSPIVVLRASRSLLSDGGGDNPPFVAHTDQTILASACCLSHSGTTVASTLRVWRTVSPTSSRELRAFTAPSTCVESVRCRQRARR
jgi:hypothetical protein